MRTKINFIFSPGREEIKAHILSSWNWGFKKRHRQYDLHNEVTRVGSCLDFNTKYGGSFPHHKHVIAMLWTDCSAGSSFFCLGLGSGIVLFAIWQISCNRLCPCLAVMGKIVLENPSCCYSFRSLRTIQVGKVL